LIDLKHAFPAWGREKVRALYQARYHEPITSWYIARATRAYKLYCPGRPKPQHHSKTAYIKKKITELRSTPSHTGFLIHFDTIVLHLQGVKRYILTGIDHASRLSYAWVYKTHTSGSARDFLLRLRYLLKGQLVNVHTDNGSEFHKYFREAVQTLGLTHKWSIPSTPKDNSILERYNRTHKE
jgi:transposase InsO family protein